MKMVLMSFTIFQLVVIAALATEPASLNNLGATAAPLSSTGLSCSDSTSSLRASFESGYLRQFDLADLDTRFAFAAVQCNRLTAGVGLSQLGNSDYYSEQVAQVGIGFRFWPIQAAVSTSYIAENFGSRYAKLDAVSWGIGLTAHISGIRLALVGDNLNRPQFREASPAINRTASLYCQFETVSESEISLKQTFESGYSPLYNLVQSFSLSRFGTVFWGITANPSRYCGGVRLQYRGYGITCVANHHPVLGLSHGISIGYNTGGGAGHSKSEEDK